MKTLNLGLGLLSIGRLWGASNTEPPSKRQAFAVLEQAYELGIRFFDTAPAYGTSEETFGEFIKTHGCLDDITIATKVGEHWIDATQSTEVDHSIDRMKNSVNQSMDRLGRVDVLQIHKATSDVLQSEDTQELLSFAQTLDIQQFGASVSELNSAEIACKLGGYNYLQFPFNPTNQTLKDILPNITQSNITPIINRPLNMGHALRNHKNQSSDTQESNASENDIIANITKAFSFIKSAVSSGVVLTGTSKAEHLKLNVTCFNNAQNNIQ